MSTVVEEKTLSKEAQLVIDTVSKLTVVELADLVKALEDKFGVVAAAPMMMGMAPGAAGGAADADDSAADSFSVILADCGEKKIQVLKVVRELTGLGLKEAKDLVDAVPKPVKEGVTKEEAASVKKLLEEQGAKVEIK